MKLGPSLGSSFARSRLMNTFRWSVVAAYSPAAFTELLRTGVALGGRTLRVMGPRARENLSYLTDAEITAMYGYLHATRW